jgi:hypothetical protein
LQQQDKNVFDVQTALTKLVIGLSATETFLWIIPITNFLTFSFKIMIEIRIPQPNRNRKLIIESIRCGFER